MVTLCTVHANNPKFGTTRTIVTAPKSSILALNAGKINNRSSLSHFLYRGSDQFWGNMIGLVRGDASGSWTLTLDVTTPYHMRVSTVTVPVTARQVCLCSPDFYAPWRTKLTSCMELVSKVPALISSKSSRSFLKSTTLSLRCACCVLRVHENVNQNTSL
jgi:hypothetical protein